MKGYQCKKCGFAMQSRKRPRMCPRCAYVDDSARKEYGVKL